MIDVSLLNRLIHDKMISVARKCKFTIQCIERIAMRYIDTLKRYYNYFIQVITRKRAFALAYCHIGAFFRNQKLLWFKVDTFEKYCAENNEDIVEIEPCCDRVVYSPPYFRLCDGKEDYYQSPSIYVAILHDVFSLGGNCLILAGDSVLCDSIKYDKEHRISFVSKLIRRLEQDKVLLAVKRNMIEVDEAINLCGCAASNYYHFTMEIMSRLEYVRCLPDIYAEVPVLIDEEIKKYLQLEQLLQVVNPDRKVIYVPYGTRVKVGLLIQPSMNTWMPINVSDRELWRLSDNLMAKSGLTNIRLRTERYMLQQSERKIYISRQNVSTTRIANELEIIPIFEEAGFEIVSTESLNYVEQIELFSSAKCVVGASGAALTNIIYCHQGTVVGCIIPQQYDFCVYSTLAYHNNCRLLFLDAEIAEWGTCLSTDIYSVDTEQCKRYIQELNRICTYKN